MLLRASSDAASDYCQKRTCKGELGLLGIYEQHVPDFAPHMYRPGRSRHLRVLEDWLR